MSKALSELSDEKLVERYRRKGDVRAFEVLVHRHERALHSFILRFLGDREAAQDVFQEVFLRIIKGIKEYRRESKFTTWLYTIARNLCIDYTRRQKFRRADSLDRPLDEEEGRTTLLDQVKGRERGGDDKVFDLQIRASLEKALCTMNQDQREVFLMRENLGLQFKEIADIVGSSENTIKSRMRYALEHLREHLEGFQTNGRMEANIADQ